MVGEVEERRKHTPDSVMEELMTCKTEVGVQVETLRESFQEHKNDFKTMVDDWEEFKKEFAEMLKIFRSAKGFFTVLPELCISIILYKPVEEIDNICWHTKVLFYRFTAFNPDHQRP